MFSVSLDSIIFVFLRPRAEQADQKFINEAKCMIYNTKEKYNGTKETNINPSGSVFTRTVVEFCYISSQYKHMLTDVTSKPAFIYVYRFLSSLECCAQYITEIWTPLTMQLGIYICICYDTVCTYNTFV